MKKKLWAILISAVMCVSLMSSVALAEDISVAETKDTVTVYSDTDDADSTETDEKIAYSMYGFCQWIIDIYSDDSDHADLVADAENALQVFDDTLTNEDSKLYGTTNIGGTFKMGDGRVKAKDATCLDNVISSVNYIIRGNTIRESLGLDQLNVSLYLMAVAEVQSNWTVSTYASTGVFKHASAYGVSEILYLDNNVSAPNIGNAYSKWYTQEKQVWDTAAKNGSYQGTEFDDTAKEYLEYVVENGSSTSTIVNYIYKNYYTFYQNVGHYLAIVTETHTASGAAVSTRGYYDYTPYRFSYVYGQVFSSRKSNLTVSDFSELLDEYIAYVGYTGITDPMDISDCEECIVTLSKDTYTYSGLENEPEVSVECGWKDMQEGTDYTLSYINNVNPGTAIVQVTGIGDFTGTISVNFTIEKADQSDIAYVDKTEIEAGETLQIYLFDEEREVTYSSSDTQIATVSGEGLITGIGEGTVTITLDVAESEYYIATTRTIIICVTDTDNNNSGNGTEEEDSNAEDGSGNDDSGNNTGSNDDNDGSHADNTGTSGNTNDDSGSAVSYKLDTLCVRRGNWFYVNYTLKGGNADMSFTYGRDTDEVLIGDWDGDGIDTICVRRGNRFYFSNTLGGQSDFYIDFGRVSDEVVVGDWDGDGCDTICVRRGNHYYINNTLESGDAEIDFTFGRVADEVLAGDWDGDGYDTLCIRRGITYYINNTLEGGNAAIDFTFGRAADSVLSGDWDGDGYDTLCIRRGNHYYINNTLEGGNAAIDFTFGRTGDEVYSGTWQ